MAQDLIRKFFKEWKANIAKETAVLGFGAKEASTLGKGRLLLVGPESWKMLQEAFDGPKRTG